MSDSGEPPATIRVLVLDEQPLLRYGICAYLNSQLDMSVCGEAGSIPEACSKIAECHPQLLVTALGLGAEDSLKLIRTLRAENPMLRVLVYSAFDETIFAQRAPPSVLSVGRALPAPTYLLTRCASLTGT